MVAKVRTNDFLYDQNRGNTQAFFLPISGSQTESDRLRSIESFSQRVFFLIQIFPSKYVSFHPNLSKNLIFHLL